MDKSLQFKKYREEYKNFYYNSYNVKEDEKKIYIEYDFEIPNLAKFNPKMEIDKKNMKYL